MFSGARGEYKPLLDYDIQARTRRRRSAFAAILLVVASAVVVAARGAPTRVAGDATPREQATGPAACAREIWIIRHGEKPALNETDTLELSARGRRRAEHLAALAASGRWPRFGAIFASSETRPPFVQRERQTVEPLAAELGLGIDDSIAQPMVFELAAAALAAVEQEANFSCALISWEHCFIPSLRLALGGLAPPGAECWPDGDFDSVSRLVVARDGSVTALAPLREGFHSTASTSSESDASVDECLAKPEQPPCVLPNGTWINAG